MRCPKYSQVPRGASTRALHPIDSASAGVTPHQRPRAGLELEIGVHPRGVQRACGQAECQAGFTREGLSNVAEQFNMEREEVAGKIVGLTIGRHRNPGDVLRDPQRPELRARLREMRETARQMARAKERQNLLEVAQMAADAEANVFFPATSSRSMLNCSARLLRPSRSTTVWHSAWPHVL